MTPEERALIDGLFDRMRGVANQPRDSEAEALIARRVVEAPHAPYALVQSVLVQEHALQQAYARVQELEAQLEDAEARAQEAQSRPASGGFLGGLFGGGASRSSVPAAGVRAPGQPSYGQAQPGQPMGLPPGYGQQGGYASQQANPWGQQSMPSQQMPPQRGGFGGGGFLQGALATAAGVAGGALLYDGIKNMMSGGEGAVAHAAAAELGKPMADAGSGDLGRDAQSALGGQQDFAQAGGQSGGQDDFWNADPDQADYADDGGDWGSDDDGSWA